MGADPTPAAPPPEWAVNIALDEFSSDRIDLGFVDTLARLLASVRDAALREAAGAVVNTVALPESARSAILALVGTAPRE